MLLRMKPTVAEASAVAEAIADKQDLGFRVGHGAYRGGQDRLELFRSVFLGDEDEDDYDLISRT